MTLFYFYFLTFSLAPSGDTLLANDGPPNIEIANQNGTPGNTHCCCTSCGCVSCCCITFRKAFAFLTPQNPTLEDKEHNRAVENALSRIPIIRPSVSCKVIQNRKDWLSEGRPRECHGYMHFLDDPVPSVRLVIPELNMISQDFIERPQDLEEGKTIPANQPCIRALGSLPQMQVLAGSLLASFVLGSIMDELITHRAFHNTKPYLVSVSLLLGLLIGFYQQKQHVRNFDAIHPLQYRVDLHSDDGAGSIVMVVNKKEAHYMYNNLMKNKLLSGYYKNSDNEVHGLGGVTRRTVYEWSEFILIEIIAYMLVWKYMKQFGTKYFEGALNPTLLDLLSATAAYMTFNTIIRRLVHHLSPLILRAINPAPEENTQVKEPYVEEKLKQLQNFQDQIPISRFFEMSISYIQAKRCGLSTNERSSGWIQLESSTNGVISHKIMLNNKEEKIISKVEGSFLRLVDGNKLSHLSSQGWKEWVATTEDNQKIYFHIDLPTQDRDMKLKILKLMEIQLEIPPETTQCMCLDFLRGLVLKAGLQYALIPLYVVLWWTFDYLKIKNLNELNEEMVVAVGFPAIIIALIQYFAKAVGGRTMWG